MNQHISDIAALVFWTNVRQSTLLTVTSAVLEKRFESLWTRDNLSVYLKKLNLVVDPSNAESSSKWIYESVNTFIYNATLKEQNIVGTVYLDDTIECRPPSFNDHELLENLQQAYALHSFVDFSAFSKIGTLLLRTPLPAIVFTNTLKIPHTFVVKDTVKAIGFQTDLICLKTEIMEFPENPYGIKYCVSGIFQIHNYNNTDSLWHRLLPNSVCYENLIVGGQ